MKKSSSKLLTIQKIREIENENVTFEDINELDKFLENIDNMED